MKIKLVYVLIVTIIIGIIILGSLFFVQNQRAILSFVKSIDKIGLLKNIHQPAALYGETCSVTTDCEGGLVCDINMTCGYCTDHNQCLQHGSNWFCTNPLDTGVCTNSCSSTGECQNISSGFWCGKDNICHTGTCTVNNDCETGKVCNSGTCVAGDCVVDADCGGKICSNFYCYQCSSDEQCINSNAYGAGYWCRPGSSPDDPSRNCINSCSGANDCPTSTPSCARNGQCYDGTTFVCTTNTQCQSGDVCVSGIPNNYCSMNSSGGFCDSDSDCYGAGETCNGGTCSISGCTSSSECNGQICSNYSCNSCISNQECADAFGEFYFCPQSGICRNSTSCTSSSDCESGYWCAQLGTCFASCTSDAECPSGNVCDGGNCYSGDCTSYTNCSAGQVCTNYNCSSCTQTSECTVVYGESYVCTQGSLCRDNSTTCASDTDCAVGSWCGQDTYCHSSCSSNTDCRTGEACSAGTCYTTSCTPGGGGDTYCQGLGYGWCAQSGNCFAGTNSCYANSDCALGSVCDSMTCYTGNCVTSDDCSGYACSNHNCTTSCVDDTGCNDTAGYVCTIQGVCSLVNIWSPANCGSDGNWWTDANNWTGPSYNGTDSNAIVRVNNGPSCMPQIVADASAGEVVMGYDTTLTVNSGQTLTVSNNFKMSGGSPGGALTNSGTINTTNFLLNPGDTLNNYGTINVTTIFSNNSASIMNAGTINCPAGQLWSSNSSNCVNNTCVYNADCETNFGNGYFCTQLGICRNSTSCTYDTECQSSYWCGRLSQICANSCVYNGDCSSGNICYMSSCVMSATGGTCATNADCASGEECTSGTCACPAGTLWSGSNCDVIYSFTWTGATGSSWGVNGNWQEGFYPTNSGLTANISYGIYGSNQPEIGFGLTISSDVVFATDQVTVTNNGTISAGTWTEGGAFSSGMFYNYGTIDGGTFQVISCENKSGGIINGGTFSCGNTFNNEATINNGTFTNALDNNSGGIIVDGTFNSTVNNLYGQITGGTFNSTVSNNSTIDIIGTLSGTGTIQGDVSVTSFGQILFNNGLTITGTISCSTAGQVWTGSVCQTPAEVCGNSVIEGTETCDDGNATAGDGCSASCRIETNYACSGEPSVCYRCGNGTKEGSEACDDANNTNGDGCSATCTIEAGYTCNGTAPSICQKCGNGIKEGTETCDDGNAISGDGCSATCTIEANYTCTSANPSVCGIPGGGASSETPGTIPSTKPTTPTTPTTPRTPQQTTTIYTTEQLQNFSGNVITRIQNLINQDLTLTGPQQPNITPMNRIRMIQILQRMLESLKQLLKFISFEGVLNFV